MTAERPFDLDHYLRLPRLSGLHASPDGRRLVVSVAGPAPDGRSMRAAWWELDPAGTRPPRRLTRSLAGEGSATFTAGGDFVFVSKRADPDREDAGEDKERARLWLLPATGGEARLLTSALGGIDAVGAARAAAHLVFAAEVYPQTDGLAGDDVRHEARRKAGVKAVLFESFPIRRWDHYLGPRERHLFVLDLPERELPDPGDAAASARDLTPGAGQALVENGFDVSPDGDAVVAAWSRYDDLEHLTTDLVAIDVATGERRVIADGMAADASFGAPAISPDGRLVAAIREDRSIPERRGQTRLVLVDFEAGGWREIAEGLDLWPHAATWSTDGRSLWFTADRRGGIAIFRIDLGPDGTPSAPILVAGQGEHTDLCPTADGCFALRSSYEHPPMPFRYASASADDAGQRLPTFPELEALQVPGKVERICATADDGTEIWSWLVTPATASSDTPAPLIVWVHGGPVGSWTGWHWRWNPHLLAERGYAVLLPDPAISTGYGDAFIARGFGRWGLEPYTDVLAAVDGALTTRGDLDPTRTALMGGSFGGYMANWVATKTDRFRAIVTHASLWELIGFHGTTDVGPSWEEEFGDPYRDPSRYERANPRAGVANIRTPMLVIHGELDHRVPISEALRLWTDLRRYGVDAKFLYFPDENHWILKPQNARIWYQTVLAFLDQHVLGSAWVRPDLL